MVQIDVPLQIEFCRQNTNKKIIKRIEIYGLLQLGIRFGIDACILCKMGADNGQLPFYRQA